MTQQIDANQVLMGGGGTAAWKFSEPNPGAPRTGTISSPPVARQEREYNKMNPSQPGDPKFYPSGDPIMGIVVEVQTGEQDHSEDDGKRTFYIEGRYLKEAVREAVTKVGAPGLEVGGQLSVTFTHREDPNDKRSRKFWDITYTPAGNAALMAGTTELTGQQAAHAQAVQQAPAQQAPAQQAPAPAAAPAALNAEQAAAFQAYLASQQQQSS